MSTSKLAVAEDPGTVAGADAGGADRPDGAGTDSDAGSDADADAAAAAAAAAAGAAADDDAKEAEAEDAASCPATNDTATEDDADDDDEDSEEGGASSPPSTRRRLAAGPSLLALDELAPESAPSHAMGAIQPLPAPPPPTLPTSASDAAMATSSSSRSVASRSDHSLELRAVVWRSSRNAGGQQQVGSSRMRNGEARRGVHRESMYASYFFLNLNFVLGRKAVDMMILQYLLKLEARGRVQRLLELA